MHAMLANPDIAPFELIPKPSVKQDWCLIDHLMVIHKIKEADYDRSDSEKSILNMAMTLANIYSTEGLDSECVILVKDGGKAAKPVVRPTREARQEKPHMEFCKRNLNIIEYAMLRILANTDMKNRVFLVTGANAQDYRIDLCQSNRRNNTVHFCLESVAQQKEGQAGSLGNATTAFEYLKDSTKRPYGLQGVFVATFADPHNPYTRQLQNVCYSCRTMEADTLVVELANALTGSVMVCSGDSDIVAVLTSSGRRGITMRMENRSYHTGTEMHCSVFGEMVLDKLSNTDYRVDLIELERRQNRFRILCDTGIEYQESSLSRERHQHELFMDSLEEFNGKYLRDTDFPFEVSKYLYKAGVRGSIYVGFLDWFLVRVTRSRMEALWGLTRKYQDSHSAVDVTHLLSEVLSNKNADPDFLTERKKTSTHDSESSSVEETDLQCFVKSVVRLSRAYRIGAVPKGSYSLFCSLTQAGQHFFLRIKGNVFRNENIRLQMLCFMMLCGTDYNVIPYGLGIKRLLKLCVLRKENFYKWCKGMRSLLYKHSCDFFDEDECYERCMQLAALTGIPKRVQNNYWSRNTCKIMCETMKSVYNIWNLSYPPTPPMKRCDVDFRRFLS